MESKHIYASGQAYTTANGRRRKENERIKSLGKRRATKGRRGAEQDRHKRKRQ